MSAKQSQHQGTKARRAEGVILAQATAQLIRATKDVAKGKGKPVRAAGMRKAGYREGFIAKVGKA